VRLSTANSEISQRQAAALTVAQTDSQNAEQAQLNSAMLHELEQVVRWDPSFGRAHLKLARRSIAQFDIEQQQAENAISLSQLLDAVAQSQFASHDELRNWMERAVGKNLSWIDRAAEEARLAVALCPLQGEAYVQLAQHAILDGVPRESVAAYLDQAIRVRPHSADVLFEIGREQMATHEREAALKTWQACYRDPGPHQLKIINITAGNSPASEFIATFEPDWPLLRNIWTRYRERGNVEDLAAILEYSAARTRDTTTKNRGVAASTWYWQSQLYGDVGQIDQVVACLEQAYRLDPRQYAIRCSLAKNLHAAGRLAEAEPHYRWCLARRPSDKGLTAALAAISSARRETREFKSSASRPTRSNPSITQAAYGRSFEAPGAVGSSPNSKL
jgi:tetratricopeptide (TPR) repeat protein